MSRLAWPCAHCGGAVPRAADDGGASGTRNDPRAVLTRSARSRRAARRRAEARRGRAQGGAPVTRPRTTRARTSAGRCRGSRTRRCSAARGASWTTSTPCPHARHAMIVRSPFAHARIRSMDVSAALALPGVVGVVTAEQIVAMSRPLPAGIEGGPAYYAAADGTARYMGEPRRRRRRESTLHRRGRGRAGRGGLRAAREARRSSEVHERQLLLRRRRRRVRRGRRRRRVELRLPALVVHARSSATA